MLKNDKDVFILFENKHEYKFKRNGVKVFSIYKQYKRYLCYYQGTTNPRGFHLFAPG